MDQTTTASILKESAPPTHSVTFREAFWVWVKVAIFSFGGPAGQIAVMHRILVEEKRWVSENRFLHALNYCMLLPGPEAQQLAVYIGWLLHNTLGGIVAGTLFVLPGVISILVLSIIYAGFQQTIVVQALFFGLKPAVMALVIEAVIRIGKRALKNEVMVGLAALAFIAIFFFDVPFPLIILTAALIGYLGGKVWPEKFHVIKGHQPQAGHSPDQEVAIADTAVTHTQPSLSRAVKVISICLALWFGPLFILVSLFGPDSVYVTLGTFFSKAAMVTFGGAYAVLVYVAQQAVEHFGWLTPKEMLDGLGMAETTPGPLIMVLQFVGFIAAYRNPGSLNPMLAGVLGSIITTWVTFVPCFMWIFLGAPYIEVLRGNKSLSTALSAITAAVVGVVLNLAIWFSLHTVFGQVNDVYISALHLPIPIWSSVDLAAFVIAIGAFIAIFRYKTGMLWTLAGSAAAGLIYYLLLRS
ncbi:MAG: chromate efflux transporter [Chloroflexi bacterium]|nr:chromate efflux transporter [Chloroflexota bacterium]